MKNNIKKQIKFNLAVITAILGLNSGLNGYTKEYAKHIQNKHLTNFPFIKREKKKIENPGIIKETKKWLLGNVMESPALSEYEKAEAMLNINPIKENPEKNLVDKTFIDKLEIISADSNDIKDQGLVSKLINSIDGSKRLSTLEGKTSFIEILSQPILNSEKLKQRQQILKTLNANITLIQNCKAWLNEMGSHENGMLNAFQEIDNELTKQFYDMAYAFSINPLDKNTAYLNMSSALLKSIMIIGGLAEAGAGAYFAIKTPNPLTMTYGALTVVASTQVFGIARQQFVIVRHLQKQLIDVATYIKNARKVTQELEQYPEIANNLEKFENLKNLFNNSTEYSANMHKLVSMLDTWTFEGKESIFSNHGRILAANKLLQEVKPELDKVISAVGEIDSFIAISKLIEDHANKSNKFSFVKFITDSNKPVIKAVEFWNPFIDATSAISNNIELGTSNNSYLNIVLTGPNTGGKSVLLKGLILNLLLAQTFGIAAAQELELTPFSNLNAYLNVTDNVNANTSLFKAEVLRAKELITNIKKLPANEFSFTIMDEVFSGTSPQEGEYAAYAFSKQLGACPNSITVIATHYHKMVNLEAETNGIFKNFLVEVFRESDGTIKRTFKLKPGINHINIAMDILKQEGVL